ncbi:MAG: DUF1508 domain-containing protein [Clostridia bacterium]|nr:DUF1508 domain-containing protein [Clostridia bacterium]
MIEAIKNFFKLLVDKYFVLTCAIILLLVVLVFFLIVLHSKRKRERAKLEQEEFKQESVQSLTPEEIDNISNNSANPEEVKQDLLTQVEEVKQQAVKKSGENKTKKQPKKVADKEAENNGEDKQPKTEKKPTAKKAVKAEPKTEDKPAVKKTAKAEPKVEGKPTAKKANKAEPKAEEKPEVKEAVKAEPKAEQKPAVKKQYTGKWKIIQEDDGCYAVLTASNGGTLLKTEKYKSVSNVKNGIETIKKNIDGGNFAISIDKYGHYRFKLFNLSNRLICVSEDYSSKAKCESGIESVKRFAKTASIIQEDK